MNLLIVCVRQDHKMLDDKLKGRYGAGIRGCNGFIGEIRHVHSTYHTDLVCRMMDSIAHRILAIKCMQIKTIGITDIADNYGMQWVIG